MPMYQIELDDGRKLKIDADDERSAASGAQAWAKDNPATSTAEDVGRSALAAGGNVIKGAAMGPFAGMLAAAKLSQPIQGSIEDARQWVRGKLGLPDDTQDIEQAKADQAKLQQSRQTDFTDYAPQTEAGKFTKTGLEFTGSIAPATAGAKTAGEALRFLAKYGVAPGVASEAAGQAADAYAPGSGVYARLATGAIAPSVAGKIPGLAAAPTREVSTGDIIQQGQIGLGALRQTDADLKPTVVQKLAATVRRNAAVDNIDQHTAKDFTDYTDELEDRFNNSKSVTPKDLDNIRQQINIKIADASTPQAQAGFQALHRTLDEYARNVPQSDMLRGDPAEIAQNWKWGVGNYAAGMRLKDIDEAVSDAGSAAAAVNSGKGGGNRLRQVFNRLDDKGLTPEERAQQDRVTLGTFKANASREAANRLGAGGGIAGSALGAGAGAMFGGPVGAAVGSVVLPGAAAFMRRVHENEINKQINILRSMIKARSPLGRTAGTVPGDATVPAGVRALMLMNQLGINQGLPSSGQ